MLHDEKEQSTVGGRWLGILDSGLEMENRVNKPGLFPVI